MHIDITDNTTFHEIQEVFADFYPYLRLEFFRKSHGLYEGSEDADRIEPGNNVGQVKQTHVSGLLEMRPLEKVAAVERAFQERFGLPVQILVQQHDRWIQTTGMDTFTLKELNEISRNSSDEFIVSDYDEGFDENVETTN